MNEVKLNTELLWAAPFDSLQEQTRIWLDSHRSLMQLRRYEQSPTLRKAAENLPEGDSLLLSIPRMVTHFALLKEGAEERIRKIARGLPEWREWGSKVAGLGDFSLGKLLGLVGNPAARLYASQLARHCGLAIVDGKVERPTKGKKSPVNIRAKSQVWLIVTSFLRAYPKTANFYAHFYYHARMKRKEKHPDWSDMRCHLGGMLQTGRLFVSHLHEISRKVQGLPIAEPYAIGQLNHAARIPPEMAIHPVKFSEEVATAIAQFEQTLTKEPDAEIKDYFGRMIDDWRERLRQ